MLKVRVSFSSRVVRSPEDSGKRPLWLQGKSWRGLGSRRAHGPEPERLLRHQPQLTEASGQDGSGAQPEPLPQGGPGQDQ